MERNVGGTDRIVRLVVGGLSLVLALAGFAGLVTYQVGPITTTVGSALLGALGALLVVTGTLGQCAINDLLGIDTSQP